MHLCVSCLGAGQMAATKASLEGMQRQGSSMHKVR
jgi:hypothetical protein